MCCDFWKRLQPQSSESRRKLTFQRRWLDYYQAVAGRPPRETLMCALDRFQSEAAALPKFAVDLGCGAGRDTVELLRRGWRVLAIDGEEQAIAYLRQRDDLNRTYLETRIQRFEDLTLPPDITLINASFCLPFCPPAAFPDLWDEITTALSVGGRFCGHLFGNRDSWAGYNDLNHHSRSQVESLLTPFDLELLDEEEHPGKTALGEDKHWHIFNIVARKR